MGEVVGELIHIIVSVIGRIGDAGRPAVARDTNGRVATEARVEAIDAQFPGNIPLVIIVQQILHESVVAQDQLIDGSGREDARVTQRDILGGLIPDVGEIRQLRKCQRQHAFRIRLRVAAENRVLRVEPVIDPDACTGLRQRAGSVTPEDWPLHRDPWEGETTGRALVWIQDQCDWRESYSRETPYGKTRLGCRGRRSGGRVIDGSGPDEITVPPGDRRNAESCG